MHGKCRWWTAPELRGATSTPRRAGGIQSRAVGDSGFSSRCRPGSRRVQRGPSVAGLCAGIFGGSLGLVWLAVRLARGSSAHGCHGARLRKQRSGDSGLHAFDFASRLSWTHDAERAWAIGAAAVAWTGIIKLAAAPFAGLFRRFIPTPASMTVFGAAMYSYLALVLLQRIFDQPFVGIVALAIIAVGVLGERAHHTMADSAVSGGVAAFRWGWRWPSGTCIRYGRESR